MHPLSWVQVLIKAGAVKVGKSKSIFWKMSRNPVQNHTYSLLVHVIHKVHKIFTASIAAGRRIISCYLISPGLVQRVFHNGHQLHMGISHLFNIISQNRCNLPVIVEKSSFLLRFSPGAQVHLIYRQRFLLILELLSGFHPISVTPLITFQICNNRSCLWPKL